MTQASKQVEECNHEYRVYPKQSNDESTNESFYCVKCLATVSRTFYNYDKVMKQEPYFVEALANHQKELLAKVQSNIGLLRQWLNERGKDDLVTNEQIECWLFGNLTTLEQTTKK